LGSETRETNASALARIVAAQNIKSGRSQIDESTEAGECLQAFQAAAGSESSPHLLEGSESSLQVRGCEDPAEQGVNHHHPHSIEEGRALMFRIFTNDRGKQKGVFMYSAFRDIDAVNASEAAMAADSCFGPFAYVGAHGPIKAVQWPPVSKADKDWLTEHVGENL
jgi:hypothetical protein